MARGELARRSPNKRNAWRSVAEKLMDKPRWDKLLLIGLISTSGCGVVCSRADPDKAAQQKPQSEVAKVPLSQIDLSQIGRVAPKGRVQDTEYNRLPVIDSLIAHDKEAVSFLIEKLDDEEKIQSHVFDYWYEVHVGDLAFVILTDLFTDPQLKTTMPGVGYDEFLQRTSSKVTGEHLLRDYIAKHGRHDINERWRAIWARYKDRAYWDETDRCFRLRDS
jgi:hypothetical protein